MEEQLRDFVKKRGTIKGRLTSFRNYIQKITDKFNVAKTLTQTEIIQLEDRLDKSKSIFMEFHECQQFIELNHANLDDQLKEREEFENSYYEYVAMGKLILLEVKKVENQVTASSMNTSASSNPSITSVSAPERHNVRLPQIQLPIFDSSFSSWLPFRDTFTSLIHKSEKIDDIEKFHYLRSSVEGAAAQIINSVEFSATNYKVAWDLLCTRFNNEKVLINHHLKSLVSLQMLTHESSEGLRGLLDSLTKHLSALKTLNEPIEKWDTLVIFLASEKLDKTTARRWGEFKGKGDRPTFDEFKTFLMDRADFLQTLQGKQRDQAGSSGNRPKYSKSFVSVGGSVFHACPMCKQNHFINQCDTFLKLPTNSRVDQVKKLRLCINCLKGNHFSKQCASSLCRKCSGKHHTLLHFERQAQATSPDSKPNKQDFAEVSVAMSSHSVKEIPVDVLLATAIVQVVSESGSCPCRVLLDSGSQHCFISQRLCDKLNLEKSKIDASIIGINQVVSNLKWRCKLDIRSMFNNFEASIMCLILPRVCDMLPNHTFDVSQLSIPNHLQLADPQFNMPQEVDILLGASIFWQLLCVGQVKLENSNLVLQKTRLGWVVSGPFCIPGNHTNISRSYCKFVSSVDISKQLTKFWEMEENSLSHPLMSEEDKTCEEIFQRTTKRNSDGRFVVNIPFKNSPEVLGDSKQNALKRLQSLESKLARNPKLKETYVNFMKEYESLGHMVKVSPKESMTNQCFYFPHHCVVNEKSSTTKLRVVFDGSAHSDSGISLNDLQFVGPTLQDDLLSIILRFREHSVVVSADVEKMYRQILIDPSQHSLQRILWRDDPSQEIGTFELQTVTYGTTSAPFLAIRCLKQLADEAQVRSPDASEVISRDFYVDDLLTGGSSVNEVTELCSNVIGILKSAHFELRKWKSNCPELLQKLQLPECSSDKFQFGDKDTAHVLGLLWASDQDVLMYHVDSPAEVKTITKRAILSDISKIFDPLGLLSPCIIIGKIMLQGLWKENLSWDETLPFSLHTEWQEFRSQLPELNRIRIPRHVGCTNPEVLELHGFSDSSQLAYGGCVYMRSVDSSGSIKVALICSKTRVAPVKQLSIPRLELCGALVLAQLMAKVREAIQRPWHGCFLWTDSMVVLGWLKSDPSRLQTFVGNRVAQIQGLTQKEVWSHVQTSDNPADFLSRGVKPKQLEDLTMWWEGPSWLSMSNSLWPVTSTTCEGELPEQKRKVVLKVATLNECINIRDFSSLIRVRRVVAYVGRFVYNCRHPGSRVGGALSVAELDMAMETLIKISQKESFPEEIRYLVDGNSTKPILVQGRLSGLSPFLDDRGILRVGGRLQMSEFDYDKKHPVILSSSHHLTFLIFLNEHNRLLHAGPQLLLSSVRDRYWPLQGRNLARKVVHKCIVCFRAKPRVATQVMGVLPEARVKPLPPFATVGVDFAGPFFIKEKGRHSKPNKCYICLYICFSTKAIHLEVVTSLSTEAFIASFRRFVSRRGKPQRVYSDNGKNFVGANTALQELGTFLINSHDNLESSMSELGVTWHFIPSYCPHFGGLWEAGVKSSKFHLKRIFTNALLSYEELSTVVTQVEAILNSRPLVPLSSDPTDYEALTPSHFLIGKKLTSLPDPSVLDIKESRLSKFQRLQQLQQHFWRRWAKEYVSELQQRIKWRSGGEELKVNTMVLVKNDQLPPLQWQLGRVVAVHPGSDNVSRVATIKTTSGLIKRGWSKICPLPLEGVEH